MIRTSLYFFQMTSQSYFLVENVPFILCKIPKHVWFYLWTPFSKELDFNSNFKATKAYCFPYSKILTQVKYRTHITLKTEEKTSYLKRERKKVNVCP